MKMTIYKTIRAIERYEIDKNDFLKFLRGVCDEPEIKAANSFEEFEKICEENEWDIHDFEDELEMYTENIKYVYKENSSTFYASYKEAYVEKEWGIH